MFTVTAIDPAIDPAPAVGEGFYAAPGRRSDLTILGHRENRDPVNLSALLDAAAARLKSYGVSTRRSREDGRTVSITVLGPKRGGSEQRYSA